MEAYALAAGVTATLTKLGEDIIGFFSGFSVAYAHLLRVEGFAR